MFVIKKKLGEMTLPELKLYYSEIQAEIDRMDNHEPADMDSDEFTAWADRHETLEDILDDIIDMMEEKQ